MSRPTKPRAGWNLRQVPRFWLLAGGLILVLSIALVTLSGVRGENGPSSAVSKGGPQHVHGLGFNPGDEALYIATHTGMWRLGRGEREAKPIGQTRQDTMGFTIAGPDEFFGSGHPDDVDEPPMLGLIESRDRGDSWQSVSLLGEADFHVLRAAGNNLYGYDAARVRLMVSRDRGKSWIERAAIPRILDLVPHPNSPSRLLATTQAGLFASENSGVTWRRLGNEIGLLAWLQRGAAYLVAANGDVFVSRDEGGSWSRVGSIGGQPSALTATGARELYAAVHKRGILRSGDGGRSWRVIASY